MEGDEEDERSRDSFDSQLARHQNSASSLEKHQEDAVNNNQSVKFDLDDEDDNNSSSSNPEDGSERSLGIRGIASAQGGDFFSHKDGLPELSLTEQLANSSMTLEVINNTRLTLARLASAAAQEETTDKSIHDLSLLQRALYNLQHQQVIQMQLIKQLQGQISMKQQVKDAAALNIQAKTPEPSISPRNSNAENVEQPITSNFITNLMDRLKTPNKTTEEDLKFEIMSPDLKDRPLSPNTSGNSITSSVIKHDDIPPTSEPNTLEMLQRTANQVLSNASQGLLTNRLIDDYSKSADGSDISNKHRCRYCGKVFGSDSALQIHLRSHTGERPFKCNICGNRFTTKGNLKVHFQRHQARFPHIKMNPHPIPEHLDKLYPPLLAQLGELSDCPPAPTGPPSPFPSLCEPPISAPRCKEASPRGLDFSLAINNPLISPISLSQDKPENLTWTRERFSTSPFSDESLKMETTTENIHAEAIIEPLKKCQEIDQQKIKQEPIQEEHNRPEPGSFPFLRSESTEMPKLSPYDQNPDEQISSEHLQKRDQDILNPRTISPKKEVMDIDSHTTNHLHFNHTADVRPRIGQRAPNIPKFPFPGMRFPFPLNFPFIPGLNPPLFQNSLPPPPHPRQITIPPGVDPAKDPNVYNSLLPRPGSTDNSWEALIEVKKTSETMKLEELVKNIEYKLEPNQCVICHRVLSCKSALQMHYRTHTGERPFKCKICNHTFTTKGNLKTHMSVHRARPHVGMLHQCPVCHKKFGNALVLQQHIRLHTGESTDLSPEQIAAAEVRDMSANFQSFPPGLFPPGIPLPPHHPLRSFPPFSFPLRYPMTSDLIRNEGKIDEEKMGQGKEDEAYIKFKNDMMAHEREQKVAQDLSTRLRAEERSLNNESTSPRRSISPSPSDYSDPEMREAHNESKNRESLHGDRSLSGSVSPTISTSSIQDNQTPLNLISRPPHPPFWSPFGLFPQPMSVPTSMPPVFSPIYMPNLPGKL